MKKKIKIKNLLTLILFFICLFGLIYSSYKIIKWKIDVDKNNEIKEEIKKNITIEDNSYKVDFKKLKETNPDTVAYIKVNNTKIDYVVVKTTDNDYYLKHNFNKEYNVAGWIFMDYRNKLDGTDKNIIIYGHNTKDNSMLDSLKNVLTKEWQTNKDNLIITLVTESNEYKYQVFSTYEIKPEDYYLTTNFKSIDNYIYFLNKMSERSNYNYKVELDKEDRILTLSSCLGEGQTRVVLHARLMKEDE